jgi:hypothetical protein
MSLQLSHLIFLVVFDLIRSKRVDIGIEAHHISLIHLQLIQQRILLFDIGSHFLSQGLELQANVMDIIINLFFQFGEDIGQVFVLELIKNLLDECFAVGIQ